MHPPRLLSRTSVRRASVASGICLSLLAVLSGCDSKGWIDPSEVGRYQHEPLAMPILSSIDPAVDNGNEQFANAAEPTADDYHSPGGDYKISKNDLIQVTISDLQGPGQETAKTTRVSDSGNISLPFISSLHAAGLTEIELEQAIVEAYRNANLIQNAQVSVSVIEARGRTFSILGSVGAPGQYAIVDSDFRVLNALVLARDVTVPNTEFLYIIRQNEPRDIHGAGHSQPGTTVPTTGPSNDELAPKSEAPHAAPAVATTSAPQRVLTLLADAPASEPAANAPVVPPAAADTAAPTVVAPAAPTTAPSATVPEATVIPPPATDHGFEFNEPPANDSSRILRLPLQALRDGDLRYNIPVHANDVIIVPQPDTGEFYMGGHVQRPGAFTLTGRKITLKEAFVSAGMFDALAIPQRTDIIRRLDPNHEIFVRVDMAKIFAGEQPDIYLRPYDQVMVGTNALAPFIAAVRGAFRITYGFGFLYDRNFSPAGQNGF